MRISKIVAAIDVDDDLATATLEAARSLADKEGAALDVLSVWPPLAAYTPTFSGEIAAGAAAMTETVQEQYKEARKQCEEKLVSLSASKAGGAPTHLLDGDPSDVVAKFAEDENVDLIVTGSHQKGPLNALFTGSPSRALIHEAPCAVFLVTKAFAEKMKGGSV